MRKSPRPFCRSHDDQDDGLARICRGARLYGGIPFLILTAFFIAAGREGDLPEFLYWLTLIWMCQIRYVESSCSAEKLLQPSRPALRQWKRFSAILGVAGASFYALAKIAAW